MSAKVTAAMLRALRGLRAREMRGVRTIAMTRSGDGHVLGSHRAWAALIARGLVRRGSPSNLDLSLETTPEGVAYLELAGAGDAPKGPWVIEGLPELHGQSPQEVAERWCASHKHRGRRIITVQRPGPDGGAPVVVKLAVALVWKVVE